MEINSSSSGRQSRLLGKLLGKLRGENRYSSMDKNLSFISTSMSENVACGTVEDQTETVSVHVGSSITILDDAQFAANIDMRYGGQYLNPEQLPEFCNQLHHLVEVIRNIQSYAKVTGEYPSELERRLEREAREVAALASEVRNAHEAVSRAREQRQALRAEREHIIVDLVKLKETEIRELENSVRDLDRKLCKSWEVLRDTNNPRAFDPLLDEIRNKQAALECVTRLIDNRKATILQSPAQHPLPLTNKHEDTIQPAGIHRRHDIRRTNKRKRKESKEPRSVPLSLEPSHHHPQQVTLYIQGSGIPSRSNVRATSFTLGPLELHTQPSIRDTLFTNTD